MNMEKVYHIVFWQHNLDKTWSRKYGKSQKLKIKETY